MEEELKREDAKITFHLDIKTIPGQKIAMLEID